ncbi:MAG: ABC transporter ATP-binding protein [Gammaproteobacteria bacterium]|nr:ABC transporter ATP-binding protein [Gammaproteobacteria bacterium]HJM08601.1 ABC transporter ATP-binding protein [Gammaproteobacteria bacterium]HJN00590.1 ABC transporter ATP-binding protein [Gammaproteobacteria bacterium]
MHALSIKNLSKKYKSGVEALKSISFDVQQGDFFALLGPNGAGKTTAIGIITSLVNKSSGSIEVFGHDIDKELAKAKSCIGVVPQEVNLNLFDYNFNILVNQAGFYGIPRSESKKRAEQYLKKMQIWEKRKTDARSLSGGMKRRLMVARALVNRPKLLLLDEPTAGVDIETRRMMWDFLRDLNNNGTTIILTTHYLEEAEQLCNKVAIIDEGNIIENDSMQNVLKKLKTEVFILNTEKPLDEAPKIDGYSTNLRSPQEIEITVSQEQGVNDAFASLQDRGVKVLSMRNKNSRLEELFLDLTKGQLGDDS